MHIIIVKVFLVLFLTGNLSCCLLAYDMIADRVERKIHHEEKNQPAVDSYTITLFRWKMTPVVMEDPSGKYWCEYRITFTDSDYYLHHNKTINRLLTRKENPKDYFICFLAKNNRILFSRRISFRKNRENELEFSASGTIFMRLDEAQKIHHARIMKKVRNEFFLDL